MKQITIFGATGLVGKNLLQKTINRGIRVKVLARNIDKLPDLAQAIEIVEGDYFDIDKLKLALKGSDVVLSTIGPPMVVKLSAADEDKYENSLAYIIEQMDANGQTRLVNISGAGIKMANENLPLARKLMRVMIKTASKSTVIIKDRELQLLQQSKLDWTTIRPPMIKEEVKGEFVAHENKFIGMNVDINQLTDFILDTIDDKKWYKKAPVVGTN